jgi:hypothetical protein
LAKERNEMVKKKKKKEKEKKKKKKKKKECGIRNQFYGS